MRKAVCLGLVISAVAAWAAPAFGNETDGSSIVLDGFSYWRAHLQVSEPVIRYGNNQLQGHPAKLEPLTENWTEFGFDDTVWVRTPGPFFLGRYEAGFAGWESSTPSLALICLRGKFAVSDPGQVKSLKLEMSFRGGVVIYLNGKEIARKHLPDGKLPPSTLADDYPEEAYVRPDGEMIRHAYGDPERLSDRIALRRRQITDLVIDPKDLRQGTNVIAIELHRAPYDEIATRKKRRDGTFVPWGGRSYRSFLDMWSTVGMTRLKLRSPDRITWLLFPVFGKDAVVPVAVE